MDIAVSEYIIEVPAIDLPLFRSLTKKMGWTAKKARLSGIDKGLEDIRKGRVFHAKDSADLLRQVLD